VRRGREFGEQRGAATPRFLIFVFKWYNVCMKTMVCGFLFNTEQTHVLLIRKVKPEWQKGRLNGIGGKVEQGETFEDAMHREFMEETGLDIPDWDVFVRLQGGGNSGEGGEWVVYFFRAFTDLKTMCKVIKFCDEGEIHVYSIKKDMLHSDGTLPNLSWLIPMALSMDTDAANLFDIKEEY